MTSVLPVLCMACDRLTDPDRGTCSAFPTAIPTAIIAFGADHHLPVAGDRGLQFKQADTDDARQAYEDWQSFTAGVPAQ